MYGHDAEKPRPSLYYKVLLYFVINTEHYSGIILENKKFFELKSEGYRDGIKIKETRQGWGMSHCT